MRHRDPCNWKRTSSMAHRSVSSEQASSVSFFIFPLLFGISMRDLRPGLSETKAELPEKPLALAHSQCDSPPHGNKLRESLSIPEIGAKAEICRTLSESLGDLLQLLSAESSWPPRPFSFSKTGKAFVFKPSHPIGNRPGSVPKESRYFSATQALSHKKNSVQSVIVAGFVRSADFILEGEHHLFRVSDFGFSHGGNSISPWAFVRNYL